MSFIIKNLPILIVVTPLMFSLIVAVLSNNRQAWVISVLASLLTMIFSILLCFEISDKNLISYHLGNWPPPLGIEYIIDKISIIPIMIISVIGLISTLFAHNFFTNEIDETLISKTYSLWLLAISGLMGLVTTADAFNLFVFLEISSLSAVALVAMGSKMDRKALVAGYNYLILGAVGATFYVIGVGLLYGVTGTLNMSDLANRLPSLGVNNSVIVAFAFMMLGIMVKAAVFPLHIWLPNAYAYAPSPVSVLLAATATKVSIYILARISYTIFGSTYEIYSFESLRYILLYLSILAMFAGTIMAIFEKDVKKLLAHSSVAQIGYIVLGISLATSSGIASGFIHLINHALIKAGLFMSIVAMGFYTFKRIDVNSISGVGRQVPITFFAFVICALSLAGLPLTVGFISKLYLLKAAYISEGLWLTFIILISSILSLIYIWKLIEGLWYGKKNDSNEKVKELPEIYIPLLIITFLNVYFGIDAGIIIDNSFNAADALINGIK